MKEFDEIDQLFQTTFDGFESTPDPSVKENIDRAIASKKKRRGFFFLFLSLFIGTLVLGAMVYSYSSSDKIVLAEKSNTASSKSEKTQSNKEKNQVNITNSSTTTTISSQENKTEKTMDYSGEKSLTTINTLTKKANSIHYQKQPEVVLTNQTPIRSIDKDLLINQEVNSLSEVAHNEINEPSKEADTIAIAKNSSNKTDSLPEDISDIMEEKNELAPITKKSSQNWYLTTFAGWEGEKRKPLEEINPYDFSQTGKESVRIYSSSFYGKVEINRRLERGPDLIAGIGFRSSAITQYNTRNVLDSTLIEDEIVSSSPDSFEYFVQRNTEKQQFRINSILLPIGVSYSLVIGRRFYFRLAAGTEFSYGWKKDIQLQSSISSPTYRAFGWNVWARPELHYSFGKIRFIVFGSMNQPLLQQLRWNVDTRRNPSFGGGVGFQFNL